MTSNNRSPKELWQAFLENIRPKLSNHVLDTWFKPVNCIAFESGTARLEVRDQFLRDWLADHYLAFIREGLSSVAGQAVKVTWVINPALAAPPEEPPPSESPKSVSYVVDEPEGTVRAGIDDENEKRRTLNKRYIFDNFVCGPSNHFAFAACKAVAENPGQSYNPVFIFGGVGLGKTHLLSAIGHQILKDRPRAHVIYTSSEQFTNEVINAVLGSKLEDFRSKYRSNCDVILMDDIQLIAGKERTQHEFFHIFNTLYDSQRQIVVTSDKLPHEIPDIEERLRNRFQWGLIADIQPPEIETRVAILRKKALSEGLNLEDDVIFFLAKNIRSNVRELEGALVRVVAHASLSGAPVTIDYARNVLTDILTSRSSQLSVESIQKMVAAYFQIRMSDLKSHRRLKALVRPRQVAMYLARKHTGASFPELGSRFGDKDHTTIMSAYSRIDDLIKVDAALRAQVIEIERQLDTSTK